MGLVRERGETSRRFSSEPRDRYPCLRRSQITMRDGHILLDESNHAALPSTGGGAALAAAAEVRQRIDAVVPRGGRPDLAGDALARVQSPTLLIVGGNDDIRLNKEALAKLRCEKELKIVPGATHLFEEPGALEAVARVAADWFRRHFHTHSEAID